MQRLLLELKSLAFQLPIRRRADGFLLGLIEITQIMTMDNRLPPVIYDLDGNFRFGQAMKGSSQDSVTTDDICQGRGQHLRFEITLNRNRRLGVVRHIMAMPLQQP